MSSEKVLYHFDNLYMNDPLPLGFIDLIQIGRKYCGAFDVVPPHMHEQWYELTIVNAGNGSILTNGKSVDVTANDIYLSFPYEFHEIRAGDEKFEYDYVSFHCLDENLHNDLSRVASAHTAHDNRIIHDEKIGYLFGSTLGEFRKNKLYKTELIASLMHSILIYVIRDFDMLPRDNVNVSDVDLLCYQIMSYIDTHIYSIRNLTEVADYFNYNYSYLSVLFKKNTNKKLSDYFIDRKLEAARLSVLENKKKISDIALLAGYSTVFSFSKAFKNKYGVSPETMRKNKRTFT